MTLVEWNQLHALICTLWPRTAAPSVDELALTHRQVAWLPAAACERVVRRWSDSGREWPPRVGQIAHAAAEDPITRRAEDRAARWCDEQPELVGTSEFAAPTTVRTLMVLRGEHPDWTARQLIAGTIDQVRRQLGMPDRPELETGTAA